MRSGLLTFGVLLVVLGAIFYFVPASASVTSSNLQRNLSIAAIIIGALFSVLGILLPDPVRHVHVKTARTAQPAARRVHEEWIEERYDDPPRTR